MFDRFNNFFFILFFINRKERAGSRKMISTDLLRERAAKAQPTPMALGQRGLARV